MLQNKINWKTWFNSPEGKAFNDAYFLELKQKDQALESLKNSYDLMSQENFDKFLSQELTKHDDAWRDKCYDEGCEPYPSSIIDSLFAIAEKNNIKFDEPLDEFSAIFSSYTYMYKGYYFNYVNGQGTVMRIFNKNKENIFTT